MEYTEIDIKLKRVDPFVDILVAKLNQIEFESFIEDENGVKAYVPTQLFNIDSVKKIISQISVLTELTFSVSKIKQENWNEQWESNYSPVFINDNCVIRSHLHNVIKDVKYEIIISPHMSFGTGHHETTSLMMNEMFTLNLKDKAVLDMGSGTGILSILASKLGARDLVGIDCDEWAFKNARKNAALNNISNIQLIHGDVNAIIRRKYDVVLVNVNRNIILNDIEVYVSVMDDSAEILLSGFLEEDIPLILEKTQQLDLQLVGIKNKNKWQILHLKRA